MDWALIKTFLKVAETGSLSAAARDLGLTQPTVGRQIAILEENLGLTLFLRHVRGLIPTESGSRLIAQAEAMRQAAEGFERVASGRDDAVGGTVRITTSETVATYILPEIIGRLVDQHPGIQVEIEGTSAIGNLTRRDADIAVRMVRPTQPDLVARQVNRMRIGLFARTSYLDRFGRPKDAEELFSQHRIIGQDRGDDVIRGASRVGAVLTRENFAFRTDDLALGWAMTLAGIGIGFGPIFLGEAAGLERVVPDLPIPVLDVWIVSHRDVVTNRRIRIAVDHLVREFSALPLDRP